MATATRPILRIRSPIIGRSEQIYELGELPVTIGRADDCDIVLLEQAASRLHARLMPGPDGWTLVDEGSQAGVFVGGQRVTRRVLRDGESFRVGATDLQLVERPASQPTVIGATRPPLAASPAEPFGLAPTMSADAVGSIEPHTPIAHAPIAQMPAVHAPVVAPAPAAPIPRAPAPAPPAPRPEARLPPPPASAPSFIDFGEVGRPSIEPSAPSFVDFGPVGRPEQPAGSAPSFIDMGPVGRPVHSSKSESFTGGLADDPSRIERVEERESRLGTYLVVLGLFAALTTGVVVLAYDVTWADFVGIFQ